MFRRAPRLSPCKLKAGLTRSYHFATGNLVNQRPDGSLDSCEVSITIGDPEESYILVDPEVGRIFQDLGPHSKHSPRADRLGTTPMVFFHDTKQFAHESSPNYPRLVVTQDLASPTPAAKRSPATLWHYGLLRYMTLNGTFDAKFAQYGAETERDLGHVLERMKHM